MCTVRFVYLAGLEVVVMYYTKYGHAYFEQCKNKILKITDGFKVECMIILLMPTFTEIIFC